MSTFTLPKYYEGTPGKDIMYHGVGKHRPFFHFGSILRAKCMAIELGEACVFVSIFRSYVQSKSRRRGACVSCLLPMGAVDANVSSNMFLCSSFYMETVRQWKNKGIKHFCDEMFSIFLWL